MFWVISLAFAIILSGCQWQQERAPSLLVIAVNSLGSQEASCHENALEIESSGIQNFCQESVRFTHTYSTSPMAQSALASLLTGLYPDSHGVWHNGSQFVSGNISTVAELALKKNYRTSFFSGGPPIWSKSGLRQGFELFDDNIMLALGRYYRPVLENFNLFLRWLDDLETYESFFSVQFLPDLQFSEAATYTDTGEARKKSIESQIAEIDESLAYLMKEMRKRKRWNDTTVVLVGLSGRSDFEFRDVLKPENLFSENMQVKLQIKPPQKNPERGNSWKIDKNVTLADLGFTFFDLLGVQPPPLIEGKIEPISLKDALVSPQVNWSENRPLLAVTGWPAWMRWGENHISVRSGYSLVLFRFPLLMYNTLTDRMETSAQMLSEQQLPEAILNLRQNNAELEVRPWSEIPKELLQKILLAQDLWKEEQNKEISWPNFLQQKEVDMQVLEWLAQRALQMSDWKTLGEVGVKAGNPLWKAISEKATGGKVDLKKDPCFSFVGRKKQEIISAIGKVCDDSLFSDLLLWMVSGDSKDGEHYRESFIRDFEIYLTAKQVAIHNYLSYLSWDVDPRQPSGPSNTELLLALPENKSYANVIRKRLANKN